jgi:hypothetical protein
VDAFGAIVDAADLDGDDMADIVVAAPGREDALGRVFIVRGADTGYARGGNVAISPKSVGPEYAQAESQFGAALSILRLTDPDRFDLAVAMGGEADRAASGDGSLGRAATVIPDIGSMLDGQRPGARQLPGLDEIQAGGKGRIRFARPPEH